MIQNESLEVLHVYDTCVDFEVFYPYLKSLKSNRKLKQLYYGKDYTFDQGFFTLMDSLRVNQTLQKVVFFGNYLKLDHLKELESILRYQTSLIRVDYETLETDKELIERIINYLNNNKISYSIQSHFMFTIYKSKKDTCFIFQ